MKSTVTRAALPSLFRRAPDSPPDYTSSHKGRGEDYHLKFTETPGRALMWRLEQDVLRSMVSRLDPMVVIDFACGTGRISGLLADAMPSSRVVGADISQSMLDVARRNEPAVEFLNIPAGGLVEFFGEHSVDLLTAFRFFANADDGLRRATVEQLTRLIRPEGHLILNNHRNFWSSSYIARRARWNAAAPGSLNQSVLAPLVQRGFQVVEKSSLGVLPQSDERSYLTSWRVASTIEKLNAGTLAHRHSMGLNTVWLLQKVG